MQVRFLSGVQIGELLMRKSEISFYVVVTDTQTSETSPIVHRLLFQGDNIYGAENLSMSVGRSNVQEFLDRVATNVKGIWKQNSHVSWQREVDVELI